MAVPRHVPRIVFASTAIALAAALTACAAVDGPAPVDLVDASQVVTEYREAAADFPEPLPPGEEFPEDPPGAYSSTEEYEAGFGGSFAAFYWRCEWIGEYGDTATVLGIVVG